MSKELEALFNKAIVLVAGILLGNVITGGVIGTSSTGGMSKANGGAVGKVC